MVTGPPEPKEANMDENIGGAGPAIAAHSKDGSAAGQPGSQSEESRLGNTLAVWLRNLAILLGRSLSSQRR